MPRHTSITSSIDSVRVAKPHVVERSLQNCNMKKFATPAKLGKFAKFGADDATIVMIGSACKEVEDIATIARIRLLFRKDRFIESLQSRRKPKCENEKWKPMRRIG